MPKCESCKNGMKDLGWDGNKILCKAIGDGNKAAPPGFADKCRFFIRGENQRTNRSNLCDNCPHLDTDDNGRSWCENILTGGEFTHEYKRVDPGITRVCVHHDIEVRKEREKLL